MSRNKVQLVVVWGACGLLGVSALAQDDKMRVRDVPIAEGASDVSYMKRRGDVRYQIPADFNTVGNFYAKKLTDEGWRKTGRDNMQRNFRVQTFAKGGATLEVRVDSRGAGSEVRLTPKGMMWDEDDQPTPKDLPLPADAKDLEYDDFFESIEFKTPSNVKTVVEYLTRELEKRNWTKTATEFDLATFVRMTFSQQKSTLSIDVRAEDNGSEVAIKTKGMQWDGMKAEVARTKQEAAKAAEAKKAQEAANRVASLRKRKDKPEQGIGQLPTLPSEGTIVMAGTTIKLPHVIAYESFENDEWLTKIVATPSPVKQDSLLAKLKKTGADKDEKDQPHAWPQTHLLVVLDEADRPTRLSLQAGGTPGHGSGSELEGTALVEDGRARGTVRLKEPGSFFDKVYTAEISFDLPVLTRDSTPAKRLAGAAKLPNSGKLTIGNSVYNLTSVVAYSMQQFDEPMTTIVLSQRPLDMAKLQSALGRKAADSYFEFIPQVKLLVDADDKLNSVSIWADNVSISGNSDLEGDVVIEDGRARGTARMSKPGDFFGRKYTFEVSFDIDILGKPISTAKPPAGGLAADSYDGLPFPEGHQGIQSEGSRFRKQTSTTVAADLKAVVDFYRRELPSAEWGEWKENTAAAKVEQQSAKLSFSGKSRNLVVVVTAKGSEASITLVSRDPEAARAAGVLPARGKARLLVGNLSDRPTAITINRREYRVNAKAGADDPRTGLNWEMAPGNYVVEARPQGEPPQSETVKIGPDETWGIILGPTGGFLATQLY